jgi:transcriptional regulator with XRE-family HTH domain
MSDKLAELRASRAATGQTDTFAEHRATFSPLRAAISAALARPGAPTQAALARAAGIAPENLSKWLHGERPIPIRAIEAMLVQLDLVIVPRA